MTAAKAVLAEVQALLKSGAQLFDLLPEKKAQGATGFVTDYQSWYTLALKCVELLAHDRLAEFRAYYEIDPKRKSLGYGTYVIQDYVKGVAPARHREPNFDCRKQARRCLINQLAILRSATSRVDSIVANLHAGLLADIRDAELETARDLMKSSPRAAGALAGVILERHLKEVIAAHGIPTRKKRPTLSDFSELLKKGNVIDVPTWRRLTYLADIRNLCSHKGEKGPTNEQIIELLEGVNWAMKTLS